MGLPQDLAGSLDQRPEDLLDHELEVAGKAPVGIGDAAEGVEIDLQLLAPLGERVPLFGQEPLDVGDGPLGRARGNRNRPVSGLRGRSICPGGS